MSVNSPTYNYNVYSLASQLAEQALDAKIVFELICIDDGSFSELNKENEKINYLPNCKFTAEKQNVGLSNNRNALAEASKHEYILFIDGDSILPDEQFIARYFNEIQENTDIIYGGRIHPKVVGDTRRLRWKYGREREDLSANERKKTNISVHYCLVLAKINEFF